MGVPRIRLRGMGAALEGKSWESHNILRIGRSDECEIALNDTSISRNHAEVLFTEQGWVVRDLGSTNGTYVNGVRISRTDQKLRPRDVIQFANLVMSAAIVEEGEVPAFDPALIKEETIEVTAVSQRSWEQAVEGLTFDNIQLPRPGQRLLTLLRAGHHLCHIPSIDDLLRSILTDAVAVLSGQRGTIVLVHEATGELRLRAISTGERDSSFVTPGSSRPVTAAPRPYFSTSLAQRSFQQGESLLCRDVHSDPELLRARSIADGAMSSVICALLRTPRRKLGVLHLDRGPLQEQFTKDDLYLADAIAASVSAGIESAQLLEKQRELFIHTVTALAQAIELRDQYTGTHTQRVTDYSLMMAKVLKLPDIDRYHLRIGTPLHDIGKIGIKDSVLRKPGKLTAEEFEHMKTHTTKGAAMLETIPELTPIIPIVRNHHERWDGKGYPDGLAADKIPRLARITGVADAFDAMTSDRPYRPGMSPAVAFGELSRGAGTQFDPECVEAFLSLQPRVEEIIARQAQVPADSIFDLESDNWDNSEPLTVLVKGASS